MQVSRDYINTEEVLDFSVHERFLKLPVMNFLAIEGIDPIAPQIAMLNAVNDPRHRQIIGCLSRRTGKTYISNIIAFLKAMEPDTTVLIVSPNYSLTGISWREQEALIKRHDIEITSKNKTEKEIHLENGSIIKFGSISQADSLVGRSYDLILFDECALDGKGEDAYNIQLRPTLDKNNSKVIFISTPRGSNYFKKFYERGMSPDFPSWASIHSTWHDNPRMTETDVREAKLSMSKAEFEQEYCASFVTMEGQVYEGFDQDECVVDFDVSLLSQYCDRIMGIDPGYRDPTGAVVLYYEPDEDKFYCVWDYCKAGRNTKVHAEAFSPVIEEHEVDMIFVDSAAAQFRVDLVSLYDIPSNSSKKSVLDGISYVQSLVEQNKLIVHPSCEHVLKMLINYRWDPNENLIKPKPVHDEYSHVADALRYALYSLAR